MYSWSSIHWVIYNGVIFQLEELTSAKPYDTGVELLFKNGKFVQVENADITELWKTISKY